MTTSAAKELLWRVGHDGARLAARLGRLSKGRNAAAHPDVGLAAAIAGLFQEVRVQGSEYHFVDVSMNDSVCQVADVRALDSVSQAAPDVNVQDSEYQVAM